MWIYIPSPTSRCAPVLPAPTSASDWRFRELARCATWREKHMPARSWWLVFRRASWMRRLCGVMCEPSTADRGAASWIASLQATRANRLAPPGAVSAPPILGTSGPTSRASSPSVSRHSCSLRMSLAISASDLTWFGASYATWATALRRDSTRRLKSALRTFAAASTLLPTPNASNARQTNSDKAHPTLTLEGMARTGLWPTPTVSCATGSCYQRDPHTRVVRLTLYGAVQLWPTPVAGNATRGSDTYANRQGNPTLTGAVRLYPTPMAPSPRGGSRADGGSNGREKHRASGTALPGKLNPTWVEWLMGWPLGWTDCDAPATDKCRWSLRMRGALSSLLHEQITSESPQGSLFHGDAA